MSHSTLTPSRMPRINAAKLASLDDEPARWLAVAAALAYTLARDRRRVAAIAALGLAFAAVFALVVYLRSPSAHAPHGCSDCGLYLGRWWEPGVVLVVDTFGLAGWTAGVGVGVTARRLRRRKREASSTSLRNS